MKRVTQELAYLRLTDLSDEWVEAIYYAEFLEFGEFPVEYAEILENVDIRTVFRKIMAAVDNWLKGSRPSNEEKSWAVLSHEVNHRKLLALLAYYIDNGTKNIMSHEQRNTSLLAARVYFKMLSIPGYKAYHIYHSQLFAQSLGCLSYPKILCENEDNYFNLKQLTREVNSVIREVALFVKDLRAIIDALQLNPEDMNFEDILSNLVEFTGGAIVNKLDIDKIELVNISKIIYEMIDILLCEVNGDPNADAIQLLFKCLLPKLIAASVDNRSANNLVRASYVTYSGLVLTKYGNSALSAFITLLQHLCYTCDGLERAEVRSARVSLVIGLMSLLPQKSYRYIVRWILKLSNTAKVAHRHIALELIAQLLNNDPEESAAPAPVTVTYRSSRPAASSENQESVDNHPEKPDAPIASASGCQNVIATPENQNIPASGPLENNEAIAGPSVSVPDTDTTKCDDQIPGPSGIQNVPDSQNTDSSMVAPENQENVSDSGIQDPTIGLDAECEDYIMSLLSNGQDLPELPEPIPELGDIDLQFEMFDINDRPGLNNEEANQTADITANPIEENANPVETTELQTPIKKAKKGKSSASTEAPVQEAAAMATDEDSQDTLEPNPDVASEDDIAGLLRQRAHTAPLAELLHAVYERVSDVSSTLRTRALALLSDCLASPREPLRRAVAELNGSGAVSRLMLVAARCVSDERAAVRKAAVALVQRELSAGPPPQPNDLGILVSLCRDASILVRSAAIAALGELVMKRPSDAVYDAFLSGPMHQMSDPETKIQEQVVTLIQQVAIDRLEKHSRFDREDPLPWDFLAAITRHNMRRHLQKACTLLLKMSTCINHRLVDVVSTHMGVVSDDRDLHCLVLLTSVARLVDYSDVNFILDYYYCLADNAQGRDQRLMPLTLELLTLWARYLAASARTALRDHLVARLATAAGDDGCRISCATLAAHLDPSNLQWANELLQLAEKRALSGGSVQEWVRAADLSLVAPEPPAPALLGLFLGALQTPPPEWTAACHGAAVAGAGRLCVRARAAAAAAAPALAALLLEPRHALQARVNALLALADICVRYTCIVEPLLGSVSACLGASAPPALRRCAARSLTRLLLAGYLRLRPPLYYRYCALLADSDADVREPAEYYLTSCLTPDAIYHHFVDCVVHYNSPRSESISFDARQLIYDVMLQRLSLVQKLNVQCRLAREVLEHAADQIEENEGKQLEPAMAAALLDSITLLCGPRMKLPKKPDKQGDVADIDDLQERVTTNIVSHKMKRTVAEVLVPAVLRLYARVRLGGGQVTAYLVRIANDLLVDYRLEIEELIENDEELVERVNMFQQNIGTELSFGNSRNLVTTSAPPEPDTPRAPRRRAPRPRSSATPRKRALRVRLGP